MRLSIHTNPDVKAHSSARGIVTARAFHQCDAIAQALSLPGTDVRVIEGPLYGTSSDYWLVFGSDLDWHLAAGAVDTERVVALQPDRDELFEIAERLRLAAAVYYVGVDAWTRDSNGLLVRRDVATQLDGTLGPGAPYVTESKQYAAWRDARGSSLAKRLITYLEHLQSKQIEGARP